MKKKLRHIASIQMGYPFRTGLEWTECGNFRVIQMKDIDDNSQLDVGDLATVDLANLKDRYRVRLGDVLFRSRGRLNTATLVDINVGDVAAAAPLLVIRADADKVLPEYLAWWINHPKSQTYLNRQASGTASRMINKKAVTEMMIEVPPLARQERIATVARLVDREQVLLRQLAEKRKLYMGGMMMKMAEKNGPEAAKR
jgi:restriction endonuclease S subunit